MDKVKFTLELRIRPHFNFSFFQQEFAEKLKEIDVKHKVINEPEYLLNKITKNKHIRFIVEATSDIIDFRTVIGSIHAVQEESVNAFDVEHIKFID